MNQYDPAIDNTEEMASVAVDEEVASPVAEETPAVADKPTPAAVSRPVTRRYNKRGRRRGKYAYAAPLGMLISLLSIIGVVAIVMSGIGAVRNATDTTQLGEDVYYFLEPLLMYSPAPFEGVAEEQDAFLNAAAYRVMQAEQIRMLKEKDETCAYPVDDSGRIAVPVEEVVTAYQILFGADAMPTHRSIEESSLTYSEADACYYVPFETLNNVSRPVIDYVKRSMSTCEIRIGFVPLNDIGLDDRGNEVEPTPDMATHFQTYTLKIQNGVYYIASCRNE